MYFSVYVTVITVIVDILRSGSWPAMTYTKCSEFTSETPTPRSLNLVSAIKASSVPMVWGKMMLESNGLSYMDFKLHVDVNKAMDGMLKERLVHDHIFTVDN